MLKTTALVLAAGIVASGAAAQQMPANPNAPSNPAVATPGPSATAPAAGANSFTEAQARARIETQGFTSVSALVKDSNGVWRGSASKAGRTVTVGVDYQGNVVER